MARIHPTDSGHAALSAGEAAERETLRQLVEQLPDDYTIFHGVNWSDADGRALSRGEVDFFVVNRSGAVLLIEQKAGDLEETAEGLVKVYGDGDKAVAGQLHRSMDHVLAKYKRRHGTRHRLDLGYLLYLPHHRVRNINAVGLDGERIVHAGSEDGLAARIGHVLGPGVDRDGTQAQRVREFLRQYLELAPSIDRALATQGEVFERLSDGLACLGERLEMDPWRLRVMGHAGSGKSLLAIRTVEGAVAAGERTLYVCFNRPLAEGLEEVLAPADVHTFHDLCRRILEKAGRALDLERANEPGFWAGIVREVEEPLIEDGPAYQAVVVDEGQDFEPEWYEILKLCMADEARVLWVEDPLQNLGQRPPVTLDGFVTYRTDENHRSPRSISRYIARTLGIRSTSLNDLPGDAVECLGFSEPEDQLAIVGERVAAIVELGYAPEDIVILTVHGLRNSPFWQAGSVGDLPLRKFADAYTEDGHQVYTEGRVLFDSIYRFKGQQAAAVILVDVDFPDWKEGKAQRALYTGMTRARRRLEILVRAVS